MKIIFTLLCVGFASLSFGAAAEDNPFLDAKFDGQRLTKFGTNAGGSTLYGPSVVLKSIDPSDQHMQTHVVSLYRQARDASEDAGQLFWNEMGQKNMAGLLGARAVYKKDTNDFMGVITGGFYDGALGLRSFFLSDKEPTGEDPEFISQAFLTFVGGDIFRVPRAAYKYICWSVSADNEFYRNIFIHNFGLKPWKPNPEEDLGDWYHKEDRIYFRIRNFWAHIPKIWDQLRQESILEDAFNPDEFITVQDPIKPTIFLAKMGREKDRFLIQNGAEGSAPTPFQLMYAALIDDHTADMYGGEFG